MRLYCHKGVAVGSSHKGKQNDGCWTVLATVGYFGLFTQRAAFDISALLDVSKIPLLTLFRSKSQQGTLNLSPEWETGEFRFCHLLTADRCLLIHLREGVDTTNELWQSTDSSPTFNTTAEISQGAGWIICPDQNFLCPQLKNLLKNNNKNTPDTGQSWQKGLDRATLF